MLVDDIAAAVLVAPLRLNCGILAMRRATRLLAVRPFALALILALALLRRGVCRTRALDMYSASLVVDISAAHTTIPAMVLRRSTSGSWMEGDGGRRCLGRHR